MNERVDERTGIDGTWMFSLLKRIVLHVKLLSNTLK